MSGARIEAAAGLLVWVGTTLLLSGWSRVGRPALADRLRPFHPGARAGSPPGRGGSLLDVFVPLAGVVGDRLAALFGVAEPLETRLRRVHASTTPARFRLVQAAGAVAGLLAGATVATVGGAPPGVGLLLVAGVPLLVFLTIEQALVRRSDRWQARVRLELPVVEEQLAMLLGAGYSLGAALGRLAGRGHGCVAADLRRVVNRISQGVAQADALREWADTVRVDGVSRLTVVLALHSGASDLGRLVTAEARQSRRDLHRRTLEHIERRAQQVWVPVTVATLVPGAILLAVPFLAALRLFSNA